MRIVLVYQKKLPAVQYGGTERIVWWLGRELARRGHNIVLLAGAGTECAFADVRILDPRASIDAQLPADTDLVHFHILTGPLSKPFLVTIHWNGPPGQTHDCNAVFISRDHATRFGSSTWVYNGIDPADYGKPALEAARSYSISSARRPGAGRMYAARFASRAERVCRCACWFTQAGPARWSPGS